MNQSPEIPIPSETVTSVQVSQLAGLTQSAAIDSLIQQNVDLTTRLNINLRRLADMERVMQSFNGQAQGFESQKEAFREEIQVLHKRFQAQESKLLNYRLEKESAEKAYANMILDHKNLKEKLESEKDLATKTQARLDKFRAKIHNYIRPLFKSLSEDSKLLPEVQSDLRHYKRYRSRMQKLARPMIRNLKFQLSNYRDRCERLEVKTTELSQRIEELLNHLRTKNEQFDADQKKLVAYHEDRWATVNAELEKAQADADSLARRYESVTGEKDRIEEENISLHNRAISSERRLEEIEQRMQSDIYSLQTSLSQYEGMWTEVSQKLDLTTVQLEAAQRLNNSLNEDLQAERQKIEMLNARIRQLKIQEVALQSVKNAEPLLAANPTMPQEMIEDQRPSKIETLFAEIESGDMGSQSTEKI